jgi:hypothetical protein
MAQSGYTPILIYASGTATNVPLAANMTSSASGAELALNYADGKLYYKNSSGVVTLLAGSGGGGPAAGSNTQVQFNNGGVFGASANFTWDGTTVSTTGLSSSGLSTLVKTVKIGDSNFSGVAVFAPGTPAKLYIGNGTVTDTTSAIGATNTAGAIASLAITPIAATNTSVTYTNASTLYIAGAPSAGTNVTLTNPYSLFIASGNVYYGSIAVTQANSASISHNIVSSAGGANLNIGAATGAGAFAPQINFSSSGTSKWAIGGGNIGSGGANDFGMYDYANAKNTYIVYATGGDMLMNTNLRFVDNTYDIGASGVTRPRNLYLAGAASVDLGAVINETGGDYDFRVESDTNTHMLFVDASTDRIGINDSTPSYQMDFGGGTTVSRRIQLQRGSDDTGQNMLIGWSGIDVTRTNVTIANSQTNFTINQVASDATRNTFTINSDGGATFNEDGYDSDFRVESDTNAYALFVDAGNSRVGINQGAPAFNLDVGIGGINTDTTPAARIGDGSRSFYIQPSVGTASVYGSAIGLNGYFNSTANQVVAPAGRNTFGVSVATGEYDGSLVFYAYNAGGTGAASISAPNVERLRIGSGTELVINDGSNDYDFRVESDTNSYALFVDASTSCVGINNSTPPKTFSVTGVPDIRNGNYAFTTFDKEVDSTTGYADFNFSETVGGISDNATVLVVISVYQPSTTTTQEAAGYVGLRVIPRGGGGNLTQIAKTQGSNISTFTVAANGDGIRVTTDTSPTLRCRLISIGGGGTSVPVE